MPLKPDRLKKISCSLILISLVYLALQAQDTTISGIVNDYYRVVGMDETSVTISDSMVEGNFLYDLTKLKPRDKVMMIQMTGAIPAITDITDRDGAGTVDSAGFTQFLSVASVNIPERKIIFSAQIKDTDGAKWDTAELIQLVKLVEATNITINGTVTAKPWDGYTGGVVTMVAYKKVFLNGTIDVTGLGFRGGKAVETEASCIANADMDTLYYNEAWNNQAAYFGEDITSTETASLYQKGRGTLFTGGGGGEGYLAGGGGGSNTGAGGNGAFQEQNFCDPPPSPPAEAPNSKGGFDIDNLYSKPYRLAFGGGGGGATSVSGVSSSNGANGGGIVVIIADSIYSNNGEILARGGSVASVVSGAGGGGGGGGSIVLINSGIKGAISLDVSGGDGGDTDKNAGYCGGTGGGGGAGAGLISNPLKPALLNFNKARGNSPQKDPEDCPRLSGGSPGSEGNSLYLNYKALLNGFLANSIYQDDTVCAGFPNDTILATVPTGGSGNFQYTWLQKTSETDWVIAYGNGESNHFVPNPIYETTWFTRRVYDTEDNVVDTALPVEIYVHNAIKGNTLNFTDTLCKYSVPGRLEGDSAITGAGINDYTYQWQSTVNLSDWNNLVETLNFNEGELDTTTYYRRIIQSVKVCVDTSNIDTITVLELIDNNSFLTPDTTICNGDSGGVLTLTQPMGGDGVYSYTWLHSPDNLNYSVLDNTATPAYTLNPLNNSTYYKRVVFSGAGNVCSDTTQTARWVEVLPGLSETALISDSSRYCSGDKPLVFIGGNSTGGSGAYRYKWAQNIAETGWQDIPGSNLINFNYDSSIYKSTKFRRIAYSGKYDACKDTSTVLEIIVVDSIVNKLFTNDTALCEEGAPMPFNETPATGGFGNFDYTWVSSPKNNNEWVTASGSNKNISYSSGQLFESTRYARVVQSDICFDTSNHILINVYPAIDQNIINGGTSQYTCFNTPIQLTAKNPTGGQQGTVYKYQWQSSNDNASWDSIYSSPNYTSGNLTNNIYYRRLVFSGDLNECKDTSAVVSVQINQLPGGDIVSGTDTLCAGDTIKIPYVFTGSNGSWSVDIGNTQVLQTINGITDPTDTLRFEAQQTALYRVLRIEDDSACLANLDNNTSQYLTTVYEVPVAMAGENDSVCGLVYQLNATPSVGIGKWEATGIVVSDINAPNAIATANNYDERYNISWIETNWYECADTSTIEVLFSKQPETVDAGGPIAEYDYEFNIELEANETPYNGTWRIISDNSGEFDDSNTYNTIVRFPQGNTGEYMLSWTITNGACIAIADTITIKITKVDLKDGFSPNGDGANDIYIVKLSNNEIDATAKLYILNQHGVKVDEEQAVFSSEFNAYIISWDGKKSNGDFYPIGYYFLVLDQNGVFERTVIELRR